MHPLWSDQQQVLLQDIEEHVVPNVAAEWEPLAIYLGVEPTLIDIIKKSNAYRCGDSCHEMFCSWIKKEKGTGEHACPGRGTQLSGPSGGGV